MTNKTENHFKTKLPFFLIAAFFTLTLVSSTNAQCNSTTAVVNEICKELERAGRPDKVQVFKFRYTNPQKVTISIEPKEAFKIVQESLSDGSAYSIEIINASLLFQNKGGLSFPVQVTLQETIITGTVGGIKIDADSRCETILEFSQSGTPLDLDLLKTRFKLEWIYNPSLLSEPIITGTQVRVKRLRQGVANIMLVIRDGNEEKARATRPILDCENLSFSDSPTDGITQIMTPDRCWKPYSTRYLSINSGQEVFYTAENVCTRPIKCSFKTWMSHYDSWQSYELDVKAGNDSRSKLTSDDKFIHVSILGRTINGANGVSKGSWTQQTNNFINNQVTYSFWNRFTVPDSCVWND